LAHGQIVEGKQMEHFTPVSALLGGIMIGLAASALVVVSGRIAGISGILGGLLEGSKSDLLWRIAFLVGLVVGPWLVTLAQERSSEIVMQASSLTLVIAGILVGFGTRLGNGCTSGHGVCGVARASPRSIVATVVFFSVAAITVFIARHVLGA
jgi:uncharacterized membrane protein YedE/YeeE